MQKLNVTSAKMLGYAGVLSLCLMTSGVQAQQLILTPSTSLVVIGQTVTITLSLKDGASDGIALFNTDTNIFLDPTYLQFVGTAPFSTAASNPFGGTESATHNVVTGNNQLRVTYDNLSGSNFTIDNSGKNTILGTFQVKVTNLLLTGTDITMGSPTTAANSGGSEAVDGNTFSNVLQSVQGAHLGLLPAPEPSGAVALVVGTGVLALMAGRRRTRV